MRRWWYPLAILVLAIASRAAVAQAVIYAVPNGDWRLVVQRFEPQAIRGPDGRPVRQRLVGLREALATASPGVTIQLLPGVYTGDTPEDGILFPRSGSRDRPITLRGMGSDTVIDGTTLESRIAAMSSGSGEESTLLVPDFLSGSNCLRLKDQQWIVLDNLSFRRCADAAVYALDSSYITLRNSTIIAGLYAFFATGLGSHHLLLEHNIWIQDPLKVMWNRYHWCEYKYGEKKAQAGALFASRDIPGEVIIRGNRVHNAFNAVRMDVSPDLRADPQWLGKLNANVEVYDNDFSFIRDNVLEPEYDATNWWFHGNRIRNAHAWFSFDGLYGGRWYVYDNVGWFDDKPSRECLFSGACQQWPEQHPEWREQCSDLHDGGRVFKFRPDGRYAPGPLYVFNNSWYLRTSLIKDGRLGYIGHWNNALDFCRSEDYPDGLCDGVKPFFNGFIWDVDNYAFGHDLSNHPDFPTGLRAQGYRVNGISVPHSQPLFVDGAHGNFTLVDGSPGRGAGCLIEEDDNGVIVCADPHDRASGPDIGAPADMASDASVNFVHFDGGLYKEAPRIVRVDLPDPEKQESPTLRIVFSTPIVLMTSDMRAEFEYWTHSPATLSEPCRTSGSVLTCAAAGALPPLPLRAVHLPDAIVSIDGELATVWGSVSDLVTLMR